jgi:D-glycero-D-manno-heptose 1,7-bisphosphate phosphatase
VTRVAEVSEALRGVSGGLRRAVFLDRDGVLNRNVFYADTGAWESPRTSSELVLAPGVVEGLRQLVAAGFLLILVSNQPNAAKGKCSEAELQAIHARLVALLAAEGLALDEAYYCTHHPDFGGACVCRKPSPHWLLCAADSFRLKLPACWMVGDRATDMECGRRAGTRTVWIDTGEGVARPEADGFARHLQEAARWIS